MTAPGTARRRLACAAFAALWTATIFWASSRPNPFPSLPASLLSHDKLLHAVAFGILSALLVGAFARGAARAGRTAAVAVLLATAYGAADEWHQSHVPGRDADAGDLLADAAGAVAGAAAAAVLLRPRRARASIAADVGDPRL
jgi:VanZ family protein